LIVLAAIVMPTVPVPVILPASVQDTLPATANITVSTGSTGFGYSAIIVNSTSDGQWKFSVTALQGNITYLEVGAFCLNCAASAIWTLLNPAVGSSISVPLLNGTYYVEAAALGAPDSNVTVAIVPPAIWTITVFGTLSANFIVGPIAPVCRANMTIGPAPSHFSDISMIVTTSLGTNTTYPLNWMSDGCDAFASAQVSLIPGTYALNLSSCTWLGCRYTPPPLPRTFTIISGQQTDVNVTIATGIA
jgi:hypothetical protein